METTILSTVDAVLAAVGTELGVSAWMPIEQSRVDAFAAVVGDFQWIHCDPARAARESGFGGTIAHGALTLSLVSTLREELRGTRIALDAKMGVLYGYNRVRFVTPVPVGSRIPPAANPGSGETGQAGCSRAAVQRDGRDRRQGTPRARCRGNQSQVPGLSRPKIPRNLLRLIEAGFASSVRSWRRFAAYSPSGRSERRIRTDARGRALQRGQLLHHPS